MNAGVPLAVGVEVLTIGAAAVAGRRRDVGRDRRDCVNVVACKRGRADVFE